MANIDIEKLICDFLSYEHKIEDGSPFAEMTERQKQVIQAAGTFIAMALKSALGKQGFEYNDGQITKKIDYGSQMRRL